MKMVITSQSIVMFFTQAALESEFKKQEDELRAEINTLTAEMGDVKSQLNKEQVSLITCLLSDLHRHY
jgi:chaperonin cofactor prefoldin